MKELKKLEEKLNIKFANDGIDLTVKLGFASREVTVQNLDQVFVGFKHPDIQDAGLGVFYKNLNQFKFVKLMLLEFRILKWAKQHLKDWLG